MAVHRRQTNTATVNVVADRGPTVCANAKLVNDAVEAVELGQVMDGRWQYLSHHDHPIAWLKNMRAMIDTLLEELGHGEE